MKEKMKDKIKGSGEKMFGNTPKPLGELAQNVSRKNPFRTNYSSICSSKVQNLTVFSIIYMIRIRFFGSGELIQRTFSGGTVRVVSLNPEHPLSRLLLIMHHSHVPLGFWTGLDVACPSLLSLRRMLLFGPAVSASFFSFLHFWPRCIGPWALMTQVNLVFLTLNYFLCLSKALIIG